MSTKTVTVNENYSLDMIKRILWINVIKRVQNIYEFPVETKTGRLWIQTENESK